MSASQAWVERREQELDVWEAGLVERQQELDDAVRQFRDEMASALTQLAARKREVQAATQALAAREEALARAEDALIAREARLLLDATRFSALVNACDDEAQQAEVSPRARQSGGDRPSTASRPSTGNRTASQPQPASQERRRHADPAAALSATEEVTTIDLAPLVVRGSVVMTEEGHILSPQESAAVLVESGAFDAAEIEALMRQGYSATAILAERLGVDDLGRPATPDRPRTRAVGAPAARTSRGGTGPHHGFDDSDEEVDEDDVDHEAGGVGARMLNDPAMHREFMEVEEMDMEGHEGEWGGEDEEGYYDDEDEEEEEEEEEEHNISLK